MYRAPEQWLVPWLKGLHHCRLGFDVDVLLKTKADKGHQESLDLPAKKEGMTDLEAKNSKLEARLSIELSMSFSTSMMDNTSTLM